MILSRALYAYLKVSIGTPLQKLLSVLTLVIGLQCHHYIIIIITQL
jgi:hypothetical protein